MKKILPVLFTFAFVTLLLTPSDVLAQPPTKKMAVPVTPAVKKVVPVKKLVPVKKYVRSAPVAKKFVLVKKAALVPPMATAVGTKVVAPVLPPMTEAAVPPVAPVTPMAAAAVPTPAPVPAPVATVAPAAKQDSKGSVFGGQLLQLLLYLIATFLAAFIPVLTAWLYKKLKIADLDGKDKIDAIVLKAVLFGIGKAEEAAHKLRDNPMDSAKKMDVALTAANKYLKDSGLPEKGADYLTDLIESQLGVTRTNASTTTTPAVVEAVVPEPKKEVDKKASSLKKEG